LGVGSPVALATLVATGIALAAHEHLWSWNTLHIKLALVVGVISLAVAHLRWRRAHGLQGAVLLAGAIVWLGLDLVG
jgi:hypothetical protein